MKSTSARELEFAEETVDFLWLDNSNSDNSLIFQEAYRDNKNSPYSIIDKVVIDVSTNDSRITQLPQSEVDRIERNLQGGSDCDIDSDNDSTSEEEDDRPARECYSTRTGRAATRRRLS